MLSTVINKQPLSNSGFPSDVAQSLAGKPVQPFNNEFPGMFIGGNIDVRRERGLEMHIVLYMTSRIMYSTIIPPVKKFPRPMQAVQNHTVSRSELLTRVCKARVRSCEVASF